MSDNPDQLRTLLALTTQLNRDEMAVLIDVAGGLVRGREVYGPLDVRTDRRDFVREVGEELRDTIVYAAMERIRLWRLREQ